MSKELDTQVNSKLDLTINKDDVLTVLISEKEEEYKAQLEEKRVKIDLYKERAEEARKDIHATVAKDCNVDVAELSYILEQVHLKNEHQRHEVKMYDIRHLEGAKRPDLARNKMCIVRSNKYKLVESTKCQKDITTKDGFTGTVYKQVKIKTTDALKKLVAEYNRCNGYVLKFEAEEAEVLYLLMTLEHDKKIKAAFIKKVVNTSDFSALLLDK